MEDYTEKDSREDWPIPPTITATHLMGSPALEMSPEWGKVVGALGRAQTAMNGGPKKTSDNPFFHSTYADLAEVLSFIRPPLLAEGLVMTSGARTEKDGDCTQVSVTRMLCHPESEQWLRSTLTFNFYPYTGKDGQLVQVSPQDVGKAITYGSRYLALALADCAPEDDDGNSVSQRPQDPRRSTPKAKPAAPKKAAPAPPGAVPMAVVGHAKMKGQPITELNEADLEWYLKFLGKGAVDPENEWRDKNLQDCLKVANYIASNEEICAVNSKISAMVIKILTPGFGGE